MAGYKDKSHYWMKVTLDKYEFPLVVAETREELAEIVNVKPATISEEISRAKRTGMRCQYVKIPKLYLRRKKK